MESNHHSTRRQGYSLLSSPVLSVRREATDRIRTDTARLTTSNAAVTPQPPRHDGDDGTRTRDLSPDKRATLPLSYAPVVSISALSPPRSSAGGRLRGPGGPERSVNGDDEGGGERGNHVVPPLWRGWDSNPRSRAHEAREDSRSSTARREKKIWPAGVEPAVSGSRNRRGGRLPHSQKKPSRSTPGGTRTRSFRVENPASSPVRPRGHWSRRPWSRTRPARRIRPVRSHARPPSKDLAGRNRTSVLHLRTVVLNR